MGLLSRRATFSMGGDDATCLMCTTSCVYTAHSYGLDTSLLPKKSGWLLWLATATTPFFVEIAPRAWTTARPSPPQALASTRNGVAACTRVAVAPVAASVSRTAVVEVEAGKLKTRKAAAKVRPSPRPSPTVTCSALRNAGIQRAGDRSRPAGGEQESRRLPAPPSPAWL